MNDLLLALLRSGAVLALALVAGGLARRSPALRLAVYRFGLLAALAVAVASPWARETPAPLVPVRWEPDPVAVTRMVRATPVSTRSAAKPVTIPVTELSSPPDLAKIAATVWVAGSGLLLARLLLGYAALARLRRSCRVVDLPEAAETAHAMGVPTPTVVVGEAVLSPFVAGARRPIVFLPKGWSPEPDVLRAVLRHETAHVANGDLRWNLFYRLVGTALWPQPLLWLLKRPMEAAGEELCDAQALASGMPSARYAECLLSLRPQPAPALGIGAVASRSSVGRRVEAILDARRRRATQLSRPASFAVRLGALALAAGAAFAFARPRPALAAQDAFGGWIQKPYSARVRLVGPDGKPVVGARAWMVLSGRLPKTQARPVRVEGAEAVVGTQGLPPDTSATLVVQAPGHGLEFARLWPAPGRLSSLALPAPVALAGRVVLPGGKKEAGLRVKVSMLTRTKGEAVTFAILSAIPGLDLGATTAADGTFRIAGLPPMAQAAYDVDDERFAHAGFADRADLGRAETTRAKDLVLRPAARFTGRVTRDGAPVAGIRVAAQDEASNWGEAVSGPDGRYAIGRLNPATYNVAADLPEGSDVTAAARAGVEAKPGTTVDGLDLILIPGVLIEGRVTDDAGKPVRTEIGVYGPAHPQTSAWVQSARTDADGRYRLRVPPGEQYVYLMDSTYHDDQQGRKIRVDSGAQTVDFRVRRLQKPPPTAPKAPEAVAEGALKEDVDPGPVPPVASFGPGKSFYGPHRLRTGGTVRLAYLQNDENGPHTVWRPDGGPADPADVAASLNMKGFDSREGAPRTVYAKIEASGIHLDGFDCVVQTPHRSAWNVYQSYGDDERRTGDLVTFRAPRALKATDLRLGIGAGPWSVAWSGRPGAFARLGKGGGASLTVDLSPALQRRDVSMRVFDANGRQLELGSVASDAPNPKTGLAARTFEFLGSRSEVARIDLLARDYEWVTFKGLRLYPK